MMGVHIMNVVFQYKNIFLILKAAINHVYFGRRFYIN